MLSQCCHTLSSSLLPQASSASQLSRFCSRLSILTSCFRAMISDLPPPPAIAYDASLHTLASTLHVHFTDHLAARPQWWGLFDTYSTRASIAHSLACSPAAPGGGGTTVSAWSTTAWAKTRGAVYNYRKQRGFPAGDLPFVFPHYLDHTAKVANPVPLPHAELKEARDRHAKAKQQRKKRKKQPTPPTPPQAPTLPPLHPLSSSSCTISSPALAPLWLVSSSTSPSTAPLPFLPSAFPIVPSPAAPCPLPSSSSSPSSPLVSPASSSSSAPSPSPPIVAAPPAWVASSSSLDSHSRSSSLLAAVEMELELEEVRGGSERTSVMDKDMEENKMTEDERGVDEGGMTSVPSPSPVPSPAASTLLSLSYLAPSPPVSELMDEKAATEPAPSHPSLHLVTVPGVISAARLGGGVHLADVDWQEGRRGQRACGGMGSDLPRVSAGQVGLG